MNPDTNFQQFRLNESELALCRSALYEALALGFLPPTPETIARLGTEEQNLALAEIASILDADSQNQGKASLAFRVRQLTQCSDVQDLESLEASYRYLFGHTAHSKVPPYETGYGEETLFQQPQELGDIAGFFRAFGLMVNPDKHERVDHISCECEFLCFLARKEAYALEQVERVRLADSASGAASPFEVERAARPFEVERAASPFENDVSMLEETRNAQRFFLKDHLGRFVPPFSKLLYREDANGFYGALGNLCYDFVQSECARHRAPLGSELFRLRPTTWMDACFTCGSGEELIQIAKR